MRILACADLHGRSERIARVRALSAEHAPSVVLLPGDLTHVGRGTEEALAMIRTLGIPVLATPGNMDAPDVTVLLRETGVLLEGPPRVIDGVTFGGPDCEERCDVLVIHEPPFGVLDQPQDGRHIGAQTVRDRILRLHPRLVTCGHVHESPGIERLGETLVVNCTMGDGKTAGALLEVTAQHVTVRLL